LPPVPKMVTSEDVDHLSDKVETEPAKKEPEVIRISKAAIENPPKDAKPNIIAVPKVQAKTEKEINNLKELSQLAVF